MWLLDSFALPNLVGLTAIFAALTLWWREGGSSPSWLVSLRGLGALCLLAGGTALVAGAHYKLAHSLVHAWSPSDSSYLTPRATGFLAACAAVLAVGVVMLRVGGPVAVGVPFTRVLALALAVTIVEPILKFNYEKLAIFGQMPPVTIETKPSDRPKLYQKDYEFRPESQHYFSREKIPVWEKALEGYRGKPDVQYLEIGMFEGRSAMWMLENILTHPTARLTGIDPFLDPYYNRLDRSKPRTYKDVFYSNLKASGAADRARIIEGFSQIELRKLPLDSYDIIYIDGSHHSGDVLEDAVLSWRLLKEGGILIFDDYLLHPGIKGAIDAFYDLFAEHFEPVHVGWQAFLKKRPGGRLPLEGMRPGARRVHGRLMAQDPRSPQPGRTQLAAAAGL